MKLAKKKSVDPISEEPWSHSFSVSATTMKIDHHPHHLSLHPFPFFIFFPFSLTYSNHTRGWVEGVELQLQTKIIVQCL